MTKGFCIWTEDVNGTWHTTCNNIFEICNGTPSDNDMKYCCYCGGKLAESLYREEDYL